MRISKKNEIDKGIAARSGGIIQAFSPDSLFRSGNVFDNAPNAAETG